MNNILENLEVINTLITNDKYRLDKEIQQQLLTIAYVIESIRRDELKKKQQ